MSEPVRNKKRLTRKAFFKLTEMLKNEEEWLKTNKPTFVTAAAHLSVKLGFEVGAPQVAEAQRLTGVKWDKPVGTTAKTVIWGRLKVAEENLAEAENLIKRLLDDNVKLHAAVNNHRGLINELYWQLELKFPAGHDAPPNPHKRLSAVNSD